MGAACRILSVVALLSLLSLNAAAETYTAETIWLGDDASETLNAAFDFGFRFASIERVTLEVRSSQGSWNGYCSGSSCSFWSLGAKVVPVGDDSAFSTQSQIPDDLGSPIDYAGDLYVHNFQHQRVWPDYLMHGIVPRPVVVPEGWVGGLITIGDTKLEELPWPEFLMSGQGEVHLASVDSWNCNLNCGEILSRVGVSRPLGVSELRIIVKGVAAPEPTTGMLAFFGAVAVAGCARRGTRSRFAHHR